MEITSLSFAAFTAGAFIVYHLMPKKAKPAWLLLVSLGFYALWDWRFGLILLALTTLNYYFTQWLESTESKPLMWGGIALNLAALAGFKYLGFFLPGEGHQAAEEGLTARTGPRPINTSGGLKSKGHPVGASGAGQVVEVWKQMRGDAGERQVAHEVDLALTHNVGGTGQTCVVHIYERR